MHKLAPRRLDRTVRLARQEDAYGRVELDSPALAVMTDLRHHRAITIRPQDRLELAERVMIAAGVRLLLVLDGAGAFAGVVTYRDLRGEAALAAAARERMAHDAVPVAEVMTPARRVEALDFDAVARARVRDVVALLRERGRQHTLVTAAGEDDTTVVRGIFSVTQIGRQLGLAIQASERAQSFAEIEQLIAHA